jgi:hypothetical protein
MATKKMMPKGMKMGMKKAMPSKKATGMKSPKSMMNKKMK